MQLIENMIKFLLLLLCYTKKIIHDCSFLLNILIEQRKEINARMAEHFIAFLTTKCFLKIQQLRHKCNILSNFENACVGVKTLRVCKVLALYMSLLMGVTSSVIYNYWFISVISLPDTTSYDKGTYHCVNFVPFRLALGLYA